MSHFRKMFFASFSLGLIVLLGVQLLPGDDKRVTKSKPKTPSVKKIGTLAGFSDWVVSLAFSPDGKTLATGSYETIKLFDAKSQSELATLKVKSGYAKALAFSPNGKLLAGGHYQGVTLWDTTSKKSVATLKGHHGYVTGVAFSPDGKQLATSSDDETSRLWNIADGTEIRRFEGHTYPVRGVAFSPDGKFLATAAGDVTRVTKPGEVKLWNVETGEEVRTFPEHKKAANSVSFSPNGKFLISTSTDETVNVYEVSTGKALGFFGGHSRPTNKAIFAVNGATVISCSGGRATGKNEVKIWNRADGEEWAGFEAHKARVESIALSPDGKTLATASYDKTASLWDIGPVLAHVAKSQVVVASVKATATANANEKSTNSVKDDTVAATEGNKPKQLRAGIIGLDTSHVIAFTKILNDKNAAEDVANCRVVVAYPQGSPDIESSTKRVPDYTEKVKKMGVEIVDSISALIDKVDVVLLETNDGRPHFEQVAPVLKAGKPVFIDKPIAASLADAIAIFELARKYKVPIFSSSSLRFSKGAQGLRNGSLGDILGCDAYSPCSLEKTHPDFFWYGIHGVETLFTVMGSGCQSVTRVSTPGIDLAVGVWDGSRIGTFRGIRSGKGGYGGTAFGTKGIAPVGGYDGYRPLLVEIVKMFRTGEVPIAERETLEIYAFMEAADESKRQGGKPVTIESVMKKAREAAMQKLAKLK